MSVWDLREWIETRVPWWALLATIVAAAALILAGTRRAKR